MHLLSPPVDPAPTCFIVPSDKCIADPCTTVKPGAPASVNEPGHGGIAFVDPMDALLICFAAGAAITALSLLPVTAEAVRTAIERSVTG